MRSTPEAPLITEERKHLYTTAIYDCDRKLNELANEPTGAIKRACSTFGNHPIQNNRRWHEVLETYRQLDHNHLLGSQPLSLDTRLQLVNTFQSLKLLFEQIARVCRYDRDAAAYIGLYALITCETLRSTLEQYGQPANHSEGKKTNLERTLRSVTNEMPLHQIPVTNSLKCISKQNLLSRMLADICNQANQVMTLAKTDQCLQGHQTAAAYLRDANNLLLRRNSDLGLTQALTSLLSYSPNLWWQWNPPNVKIWAAAISAKKDVMQRYLDHNQAAVEKLAKSESLEKEEINSIKTMVQYFSVAVTSTFNTRPALEDYPNSTRRDIKIILDQLKTWMDKTNQYIAAVQQLQNNPRPLPDDMPPPYTWKADGCGALTEMTDRQHSLGPAT